MEQWTLQLRGTQRMIELAYYLLESAREDAHRYSQCSREELEKAFAIELGSLVEVTIRTRSTQAIEVVYRSPNF